MKINYQELEFGSLIEWAIVEAVAQIKRDELIDTIIDPKSIEVTMSVNEKEVDVNKLFGEIERQMDRMITSRAKDLIAEKISNVKDSLSRIEDETVELLDGLREAS